MAWRTPSDGDVVMAPPVSHRRLTPAGVWAGGPGRRLVGRPRPRNAVLAREPAPGHSVPAQGIAMLSVQPATCWPTSRRRSSRMGTGAVVDDAVRESLGRYREKRDFESTPEPSGERTGAASTGERRFVVQRHRARNLHYDLRFEIDGVLVSWAVPKGPTLDPSVRRMAVHVEDHPVEYADFEGVIPKGEYGGGDVIVWDRGTWEPHGTDDPMASVADGELHAEVHGTKLHGRLVLVRTERKPDDRDDGKEHWLLLHKHDDHAVEGWDPEDHPRSVLSGRTNAEVEADPDRRWHSELPAAEAAEEVRSSSDLADEDELAGLEALGKQGVWQVF